MPKTIVGVIADDNPGDSMLASELLDSYLKEKHPDIELILHHVLSGEILVEKVFRETGEIHFVLVDYVMAGMNGAETIARIKENGFMGGVFGYAGNGEFRERMINAGAEGFVKKQEDIGEYQEGLGSMIGAYILRMVA